METATNTQDHTITRFDLNGWEHPSTGQYRRYIDFDAWTKAAGFDIYLYNTGNIHWAFYKGEKFANGRAACLRSVKVWIDEDEQVHVDRWSERVDVTTADQVRADVQAAWDTYLADTQED